MSGHVKLGLILAAAILAATAMWIYFSPYQTCVRAYTAGDMTHAQAATLCARR
jgi:hypothetical protein